MSNRARRVHWFWTKQGFTDVELVVFQAYVICPASSQSQATDGWGEVQRHVAGLGGKLPWRMMFHVWHTCFTKELYQTTTRRTQTRRPAALVVSSPSPSGAQPWRHGAGLVPQGLKSLGDWLDQKVRERALTSTVRTSLASGCTRWNQQIVSMNNISTCVVPRWTFPWSYGRTYGRDAGTEETGPSSVIVTLRSCWLSLLPRTYVNRYIWACLHACHTRLAHLCFASTKPFLLTVFSQESLGAY